VNPTASILKYISEMDIEMLLLILDDSKTYQEATKDVFLIKLKGAFNKFKSQNDTNLTYYPGVCQSTECTNTGCKGYSFVGNNSGTSLDLIFDEKNGEVFDMYYCRALKSNKPEVEDERTLSIHIWTDEEAGFVPSTKYLYQVQQADKAVEEIINDSESCFTKEKITYLVEKYKELYHAVPDVFSGIVRFDAFKDLYGALEDCSKYFEFPSLTKMAIEEYEAKDMEIEANLINWLLDYEEHGLELINIVYFLEIQEDNNGIGELIFTNSLKFVVSLFEFEDEIKFARIFEESYWPLLDKLKQEIGEIPEPLYEEGKIFHLTPNKKLKEYFNESKFIKITKVKLIPDSQICNWVPLRYLAQDSKTANGIKLTEAHKLFHQDEFEEALTIYKDLLETRNDYQEAWIGSAVSNYMLGNYNEALIAIQKLHEWRYRDFINMFTKQCEIKSKEI
jgi:hypothetical protein